MSAHLAPKPGSLVRVIAPARLHMGFLDLGGSLGRRFGSIGIGINEIATRIVLSADAETSAHGPDSERALQVTQRFFEAAGFHSPVAIRIEEAIPGHIGLGSGTQLALAIGTGMARLFQRDWSPREVAAAVARGARSGIGIAVFEQGGLVVDGGRGAETVTPPVLCRMRFPEDWRFILILDKQYQGLHGKGEANAFAALPPFPATESARLCHLLLMRALPALAEADIDGFGSVITEVQSSIGNHFASVQGGCFTSAEVGRAVACLKKLGAVGIGQSSWGPTAFCLVPSATVADRLIRRVGPQFPMVRLMPVSARNHGADVIEDAPIATAAKRPTAAIQR